MRKTKEETAITRNRLISVGLSVFSKKGYSATTLEDIAREAGVTRGAIYWHFKGKPDLYNAIVREFSERGRGITERAIAEGGTFLEVLRRVFVRLLYSVEDDRELREAIELTLFKTESVPELEPGRKEQIDASRLLITGITEAMGQGVAMGDLRPDLDPKQAAMTFMALQNGAIYLWLSDPVSFSLKSIAEAMADILIKGISNR